MLVGAKDLLLNLLIIVTPILIYPIVWMSGTYIHPLQERKSKVVIGLCSALSVVLSMSFPFSPEPGFPFDLCLIPIVICFLYADPWTGMPVVLAMLAYRVYLGGIDLNCMLPWSIIVPLALSFFASRYHRWSRRTKLLFVLQFSFCQSLLIASVRIWAQMQVNGISEAPYLTFFLTYTAVHVLATWLTVYLTEKLLEGASHRAERVRSEKLHILSELAASVAHEIRNPMTTARGFMQLLQQLTTLQQPTKLMYYEMIIQELDRAQSIISDYLALAKPHAEKREPLDLDEQANHIIDLLSPFAMIRHVEIEKTAPATPVYIYGNQEKFVQCLVNLMKNGIEAMGQGGTLRIVIDRTDDLALIDVIDHGVGMTDKEVQRLGEPFYSTKKKGTGLGMMLCFRIIEGLGGKIEIRSKKGKGTHCRLMIPVYTKI